MTQTARWEESMRDVANIVIHADPVMRWSFRRAERIFLATRESLRLVPTAFQQKCTVQLGIGLSREYLGWTGSRPSPHAAELRLLYAGRLVEWKGLDLAIHAVRRLRDHGVRVRFVMVGDGPAGARLRRLTAELGVEEQVRWTAWLPRDRLRESYHEHDALLFPSLRDSDGMVVLEAMANGLPVVCTDCGGPSVIVNGRCGRVVPTLERTKDEVIGGMVDALHELSCDRALLRRLGRAARSRAWEFDFQKIAARVHPLGREGDEPGVGGVAATRLSPVDI